MPGPAPRTLPCREAARLTSQSARASIGPPHETSRRERTPRDRRQRRDRLRPRRHRRPPRSGAAARALGELGRTRRSDGREDARPPRRRDRPRARADRHRPAAPWPTPRSWSRRWSRTTTSRRAARPSSTASSARRRSSRAPPRRCRSSGSPQESGRPERFVGLHVFNPVTRMKLVELIFPRAATEETRAAPWRCARPSRRRPVEVPDVPGLRRQPPAVPLPVQRGAPDRRDRHRRGRRRHLHAARRWASDGSARAARPRRPGRLRRRSARRSASRSRRASSSSIAEGALGRKSGRGFHVLLSAHSAEH